MGITYLKALVACLQKISALIESIENSHRGGQDLPRAMKACADEIEHAKDLWDYMDGIGLNLFEELWLEIIRLEERFDNLAD
ncbi:MAG: hypothetical protein IJH92_08680 [Mogibacterium sp.]|nr:hypothetical protein [Mogibacterium sp.]